MNDQVSKQGHDGGNSQAHSKYGYKIREESFDIHFSASFEDSKTARRPVRQDGSGKTRVRSYRPASLPRPDVAGEAEQSEVIGHATPDCTHEPARRAPPGPPQPRYSPPTFRSWQPSRRFP